MGSPPGRVWRAHRVTRFDARRAATPSGAVLCVASEDPETGHEAQRAQRGPRSKRSNDRVDVPDGDGNTNLKSKRSLASEETAKTEVVFHHILLPLNTLRHTRTTTLARVTPRLLSGMHPNWRGVGSRIHASRRCSPLPPQWPPKARPLAVSAAASLHRSIEHPAAFIACRTLCRGSRVSWSGKVHPEAAAVE